MRTVAGLDFGTVSVRGVLLDAESGARLASHAEPYRHGVLDRALPDGTPLPPHYALQVADDYLDAAARVLARIGRGRRVVGLGVDATASSPLPACADGTPLSASMPAEPHAYVKLWKHHAAEAQAQRINDAAPPFLRRTGGRTSSEWSLAKAMQVAEEAPRVWAATERWIEVGDWVVWQLTGSESRSRCLAMYKAHHDDVLGYPGDAFLPGYARRLETGSAPLPVGAAAGLLGPTWLAASGIVGPTVVASAMVDAHAVLPAVGVTAPGTWVGTLGTSACYLALGLSPLEMPGLSGSMQGGALPALWCHEAGQPAFGDALAWFASVAGGGESASEASLADWARRAAALPARSERLLALDWWNGNRCPHGDTRLSGLIVGLTPDTGLVEMFRAIETGLCFGARAIRDGFIAHGVPHHRVVMTGGVAERSPSVLQRMADVLAAEVEVPRLNHATAVGAAIHGAVAAELCDFAEGSRRFGAQAFDVYRPEPASVSHLDTLYRHYDALASSPAVLAAMRALQPAA